MPMELHVLVCDGLKTCKGRATLVKYIMEMKRKLALLASSALDRQSRAPVLLIFLGFFFAVLLCVFMI